MPPSGGPAAPLLDRPPPGSPLARNPALLQATLDSYEARLSASDWSIAYGAANATDWTIWIAQQVASYVPALKPWNVGFSALRGGATNFGSAVADPNNTWGQAFAFGAYGAQVSAATSVLVPGVGKAGANGLPTVGGVLTNTVKRLITMGVGDFNRAVVQHANQ
jgi:hypothetical protein